MKPTKEDIENKKREVSDAICSLNEMLNEFFESSGEISIGICYVPSSILSGSKKGVPCKVTINYDIEV